MKLVENVAKHWRWNISFQKLILILFTNHWTTLLGPDPECDKKCLNNGYCTKDKICKCSEGYLGRNCELALCFPQCLNGGNCTSPAVCSCPKGFQGRYCEGGEWSTRVLTFNISRWATRNLYFLGYFYRCFTTKLNDVRKCFIERRLFGSMVDSAIVMLLLFISKLCDNFEKFLVWVWIFH